MLATFKCVSKIYNGPFHFIFIQGKGGRTFSRGSKRVKDWF